MFGRLRYDRRGRNGRRKVVKGKKRKKKSKKTVKDDSEIDTLHIWTRVKKNLMEDIILNLFKDNLD